MVDDTLERPDQTLPAVDAETYIPHIAWAISREFRGTHQSILRQGIVHK
jgi:hypothetical protein